MKRVIALLAILAAPVACAEEIGSVDTAFKLLGPDRKIVDYAITAVAVLDQKISLKQQ